MHYHPVDSRGREDLEVQIVTVALGRVNGLLRFADDSPMPTRIWHSWPLDGRRGSCFQRTWLSSEGILDHDLA